MGLAASGTDVPLTRSFSSRQDRFQSGAACALDLRRLLLFLLRLLLIPRQARLGVLLHPVRTQAKRVTKVYRITRSEAIRVEPAREAEAGELAENSPSEARTMSPAVTDLGSLLALPPPRPPLLRRCARVIPLSKVPAPSRNTRDIRESTLSHEMVKWLALIFRDPGWVG